MPTALLAFTVPTGEKKSCGITIPLSIDSKWSILHYSLLTLLEGCKPSMCLFSH